MFSFDNILGTLMVGTQLFSGVQQYQSIDTQGSAQQLGYQAQQQQLQADIEAADYNRQVALQNARLSEEQTDIAVSRQDRLRRLRQGTSRAAASASGIGVESFGDVIRDNAVQEELDLSTIRFEGDLRTSQFEQQADLLSMSKQSMVNQMPYIKAGAVAAKKGTSSSKAGSILSGISSGIGLGYKYGVFE
jgi:hypothetical protein